MTNPKTLEQRVEALEAEQAELNARADDLLKRVADFLGEDAPAEIRSPVAAE